MVLNVNHIIESGGILLVALIVFAESGMLVGFFLPGDTLLFPAGFFAAQGKLPIVPLILAIIIAAMIGDNLGYTIGHKTGKRIFRKQDGLLFRVEYLKRAEVFYEKHGGKTILLARFLPIVRTFAPVVAGVGNMPRRRFVFFDMVGCILWGAGVTLAGYFLGSRIPNVEHYILPAIVTATVLTFGPTIYRLASDKQIHARLVKFWRRQ
ncbi:VTT domain-containing protein [Candidatus Saccharibacteria bacterium]|nr:VTT domain-containing protein [Candidatus Saccharibacteria bacterium]